nr:Chain E, RETINOBLASTOMA-LIKE PROTEIN 1 [Homo sapiens]1H28_F Chain F, RETINOBLASTOMA-LIKE PROTEIN 1 [Homo sapiens]
AGSAKRRLFGE